MKNFFTRYDDNPFSHDMQAAPRKRARKIFFLLKILHILFKPHSKRFFLPLHLSKKVSYPQKFPDYSPQIRATAEYRPLVATRAVPAYNLSAYRP